MVRKSSFKFDFNEDADPVEELHRLRVATAKHFGTLDALMEYHRSTPSAKELIAELDREIAKKETGQSIPWTSRKDKKGSGRRKNVKRVTYA